MDLEFKYENPVNQFHISGNVTRQDLKVMQSALFRFFESNPEYVVLNISRAQIHDSFSKILLSQLLTELNSLASSHKIQFQVIKTAEEAATVGETLLKKALLEKEALLQSKNKIREDLRNTFKSLMEENEKLKNQLNSLTPVEVETSEPQETGSLSTLLERFWSTK